MQAIAARTYPVEVATLFGKTFLVNVTTETTLSEMLQMVADKLNHKATELVVSMHSKDSVGAPISGTEGHFGYHLTSGEVVCMLNGMDNLDVSDLFLKRTTVADVLPTLTSSALRPRVHVLIHGSNTI